MCWLTFVLVFLMFGPFPGLANAAPGGFEPLADFKVSESSVNYYDWFDNASMVDLTGDAVVRDGNLTLELRKEFEDDFNRTELDPWVRTQGNAAIVGGQLKLVSSDGTASCVTRPLDIHDIRLGGQFQFSWGASKGGDFNIELNVPTHLIRIKVEINSQRMYVSTGSLNSSYIDTRVERNLNFESAWNDFFVELCGDTLVVQMGGKEVKVRIALGEERGEITGLSLSFSGNGYLVIDDLVAHEDAALRGTATSVPIELPRGHVWEKVGMYLLSSGVLQVLDASTMEVVPGFEFHFTDTGRSVDIRGIHFERYPAIRLRIEMVSDHFDVPLLKWWSVQFTEGDTLWMDSFETAGNVSVNEWGTFGETRIYANTTVWRDGFDRSHISPWTVVSIGEGSDVRLENGRLRYDVDPSEGSLITIERAIDLRDVEVSFRWLPMTAGKNVLNMSLQGEDGTWVALASHYYGWYFDCLRWDGTSLDRTWGGSQGALKLGVWKEIDLRNLIGQDLEYTIDEKLFWDTDLLGLEGNISTIRFTFFNGTSGYIDDVMVARSHVELEAVSVPVELPPGMAWSGLAFYTYPHYSGSMHIDVLDGRTGEVVPGYHDYYSYGANLTGVDPRLHPSLKLRMHYACLEPEGGLYNAYIDWWQLWWMEQDDVYLETFDDDSGVALTGDIQVEDGRLENGIGVLRDEFQRPDLGPWSLSSGLADTTLDGLFMRTYGDQGASVETSFRSIDGFHVSVRYTARELVSGLSVTLYFSSGVATLYYDEATHSATLHGNDGSNQVGVYSKAGCTLEEDDVCYIYLTVKGGSISARLDAVELDIKLEQSTAVGISLYVGPGDVGTWHRVEVEMLHLEGSALTVPIALPEEDGWLGLDLERSYWMGPRYNLTILDGKTLRPVDGFENLSSGRQVTNLSAIDRHEHPTIRIRFDIVSDYYREPGVNLFRIIWLSQPGQVVQTREIDTIWVQEDVPVEDVLDLREHFGGRMVDIEGASWEVVNVSSPDQVLPVLTGPMVSIDLPTPDWNGNATFEVLCRYGDFSILSRVITVVVVPVDDAPVLDPLGELDLVEDEVRVLDVTPFVHDVDTPLSSIRVTTDCPECTVVGLNLSFLFTKGGFDREVVVYVEDATFRVDRTLLLHVTAIDDAPVISQIPQLRIIEDVPFEFDLSPYVFDEDTPLVDLRVVFEGYGVRRVQGFVTTLMFPIGGRYFIDVTVSDGTSTVGARLPIEVIDANDNPIIVTIGDCYPPIVIELEDGVEKALDIVVFDEDGDELTLLLETDWSGMWLSDGGILNIKTTLGTAGEFEGRVIVSDGNGSSGYRDFTVLVRHVNHPPGAPIILAPLNHSEWREGETIRFLADASDEDVVKGQSLTVEWNSNISGTILIGSLGETLDFTHSSLPPGTHRITVSVTDGEYVRTSWVEIRIAPERTEPPSGGDDPQREQMKEEWPYLPVTFLTILVTCMVLAWYEVIHRTVGRSE